MKIWPPPKAELASSDPASFENAIHLPSGENFGLHPSWAISLGALPPRAIEPSAEPAAPPV